jgi:integrase
LPWALGGRPNRDGPARELLEDFLHRRYRERSPGTRKKVRAQIRSFFTWVTRLDKLEHNPAERLSRPRRGKPSRRRAFSDEKIQAIIEAQPDLRDRVAIALMARHGLRKDELRRLRWHDIDFEAGSMQLHAKGGKRPTLPIAISIGFRPATDEDQTQTERQPRSGSIPRIGPGEEQLSRPE